MKQTLLLITTAMLLTACNFSILGENDDEVVLEKLDLKIVERNINIEELSGKWVIDKASIERNLRFNRFTQERVKIRRKELMDSYIIINNDSTVSFKDSFNGGKIYKGSAKIESLKEWEKSNVGYFLYISYKVDYWKSKDLYCLELNNKFYLGEKYYGGEEETNSRKMHYLLYEKLEETKVNHEPN